MAVEASPPGVVIRPMERREAPAVGALTLASYDAHGSLVGSYRDYLADPLQRLEGCTALYVAELAGEVVGTVTYVEHGDAEWEGRVIPDGDAGFRVLAVAPEAEGRGVGRELVARCLSKAHEDGRRRVLITSMEWMTRAHRLYESFGFIRRPDLDVLFPGGTGLTFTCDLVADAGRHFPPAGPVPNEPPWFEEAWAD